MKAKMWIVTALALTTACGMVSAARAGSGRATGPTGASPAPAPPPQEQKPSEPPRTQRPTESGQNPDQKRESQAEADKRARLFEETRFHHK